MADQGRRQEMRAGAACRRSAQQMACSPLNHHRPASSWRACCPPPAGQLAFHTRTLDDHVIKASFVPEEEYSRAQGGEWVLKHRCAPTRADPPASLGLAI